MEKAAVDLRLLSVDHVYKSRYSVVKVKTIEAIQVGRTGYSSIKTNVRHNIISMVRDH